LVNTRPSGEANEPVQPPSRRAIERCRRPSHASSMSTPYFCFTVAFGKLSNVHMPSSASAAEAKPISNSREKRDMVRIL
jgi:hypothetical protein